MLNLEDFDFITHSVWIEKVKKDLKGKDISTLNWKNLDGVEYGPIHTQAVDSSTQEWTSWRESGTGACKTGIPLTDEKSLAYFLKQPKLKEGVGLVEIFGNQLKKIENSEARRFLSEIDLIIKCESDFIIPDTAGTNFLDFGFPSYLEGFNKKLEEFSSNSNKYQGGGRHSSIYENKISNAPFFDSWASPELQLGAIFSVWTSLIHKSENPKNYIKSTWFEVYIGPDFLQEISKLRAFKMICEKFLTYYFQERIELPPIILRTPSFARSPENPHNELIRDTIISCCAFLNNPHALIVSPFLGSDSEGMELALRLARNCQLILKNESFLGEINDPIGGSYFIEKASKDLADKIWDDFVRIESEGGWENSNLLSQIEKNKQDVSLQFDTREKAIIGENIFYQPLSFYLDKEVDINSSDLKSTISSISELRNVRKKMEDISTKRGKKVEAVLFMFGKPTWARARKQFASLFLEAGGIRVKSVTEADIGQENSLEMADLIILCSSDADYQMHGTEIVKKLKTKIRSETPLILAGNPSDLSAEFNQEVSLRVFEGRPLLDFFNSLISKLN